MKKYFIGVEWKNVDNPVFHFQNSNNYVDEYYEIPRYICLEKQNEKKCIGISNPLTRQNYICDKKVDMKHIQCYSCMQKFDFYNCVRCHGNECGARCETVKEYCNTSHYVYLAYFSREKIKVGTASEIRKYERLLEQGAVCSIFIAKTPSGRIARKIEKSIIDDGYAGVVTSVYKMKNILIDEKFEYVKERLQAEYEHIKNDVLIDEFAKYLIRPEFNFFETLSNKIIETFNIFSEQTSFFNSDIKFIQKQFVISNALEKISGKVLFILGNILAISSEGVVKLYDVKKLEGFLLEYFENDKERENENEKGQLPIL